MAQAEVIVRALEALDAPSVGERVDRELLRLAEQHLVEKAADFTPPALRTLGERILEVICPEQYDDTERKALLAAERRASAATRLTLHVRGDGSVDVRARIPEASAARLQTYLEAFTAPRRAAHDAAPGATSGDDPGWATPGATDTDVDEADGRRVPADQRRGQAFCALLEAVDPDRLPLHGGTATTVVVTIPYDGLATGDGCRHPRRRHPHLRRRGPPAGLHRRDHPRRPRRELRGPRPRPHPTPVLRRRSARPSPSSNAPARPTAAPSPPPGAKHITPATPGAAADARTSPTACSSAPGTTTASTTTATRPRTHPTDESASTGGRRPTRGVVADVRSG